jgi:hypothetical protein
LCIVGSGAAIHVAVYIPDPTITSKDTMVIANDAEDFLAIGAFVGWSLALLGVIEDVALSPMMPDPPEIVC